VRSMDDLPEGARRPDGTRSAVHLTTCACPRRGEPSARRPCAGQPSAHLVRGAASSAAARGAGRRRLQSVVASEAASPGAPSVPPSGVPVPWHSGTPVPSWVFTAEAAKVPAIQYESWHPPGASVSEQ
jgi:hypothetical protein